MPRGSLLRNVDQEELRPREAPELTPKEKRKNWWVYHRVPLLIAVIVTLIVVSIFSSVFFRAKPDYQVALVTSFNVPDNGRSELARCIREYADDRNGDGQVLVEIIPYVFPTDEISTPNELEQLSATLSKFVVDAAENDYMIFLFDEGGFAQLQENFSNGFFRYLDGSPMPDDARDYENAGRAWNDFAAFSAFVPRTEVDDSFTADMLTTLYNRLTVYFRASEGSSIERSEKDMAYYRDSAALYDRLLTGALPE